MFLLFQLLTISSIVSTGESFLQSSSQTATQTIMRTPPSIATSSPLLYYSRLPDQDPDEMRREIEAMRQEALQKLQVLQERMQQVQVMQIEGEEEKVGKVAVLSTTTLDSLPASGEEVFLDFMEREKAALEETNNQISGSLSLSYHDDHDDYTTTAVEELEEEEDEPHLNHYSQAESLRRLDDTRWRVMLNIGREPGTWMPTEWGASGERLYLQLELEFSSEALMETFSDAKHFPGDDFLNGRSNTKLLKVVHNEASLSPTLKEGARKVRVQNGGWRVAPYEGPMGTTVLRFYVELEEQVAHEGSDVWCPAGRVYCTCGYFPMYHDPVTGLVSTCSVPSTISTSNISPVSLKDALKKEQSDIAMQFEALARANSEDPAILSWNKLKRSSQMMKLKQQAQKLAHKRHELHIKEPDKALLRLSQDQQVGLTKEGGVCCKVHKGLAVEYHMLGKFEIASMQNRDHTDYRQLLP